MSSFSRYQRTVPSLASLSISYSCLSFFHHVSIPFSFHSFLFLPFPFLILPFSFCHIVIPFPFPFLLPQTIGTVFIHFPTAFHPLSCFNSSFPRISVPYPLFPHLSLVSQFFLSIISSFLSRLLISHPLLYYLFRFYVLLNLYRFYLICSFLNPSLLSSFSSSLYFLPSSVLFAPFFSRHTFSAIFSRYLLLSTTLLFFPCRMRRAERCRPLAAPWRPFSAASSAASWRSTPPSTTSTSDARAICWRATDRCPTTTAITSLFWWVTNRFHKALEKEKSHCTSLSLLFLNCWNCFLGFLFVPPLRLLNQGKSNCLEPQLRFNKREIRYFYVQPIILQYLSPLTPYFLPTRKEFV